MKTLSVTYASAPSADPLYLEWQYDKTPESEQVWRDNVSEIKAQLPIVVSREELY